MARDEITPASEQVSILVCTAPPFRKGGAYRKTADLINLIRQQEQGGTSYRTLQDNTEKEGTAVIDYIEEKTKRILKDNGFSEDGIYSGNLCEFRDIKMFSVYRHHRRFGSDRQDRMVW